MNETETTTTETTTYEVPVIVTVHVELDQANGNMTATVAGPDCEGAPWPFSGYPCAFDTDAGEWAEPNCWPQDTDDEDPDDRRTLNVYNAAEDAVAKVVAAVGDLAKWVALPEWNVRGSMCDWIECINETAENSGVTSEPVGLCPECDSFRPDRVSEDGTWEQDFATACPSCGAPATVEPAPEPIRWTEHPAIVLDVYNPADLASWRKEHPHNGTTFDTVEAGPVADWYRVTGTVTDLRELLAAQWDLRLSVDTAGEWALSDIYEEA